MKVLVITNLFPNTCEPNRATFNFQHLSELSKITELEVIAPISWHAKLKRLLNHKKFINYSLNDSCVITYHPSYFYIPKYFRCLQGVFYFLSIITCCTKCIRNSSPDIILGTWAYPDGFAAVLLGKIFKLPVVIKVHGTDIHSVNTQCKRKLTRWTLKHAHKVVSVSESLAKLMRDEFSLHGRKIVKIQNGVDTEKFYPISKAKALLELGMSEDGIKNIIYIGNLKPEKCPIDLLEAFDIVVKRSPQKVRLHYIGDGPQKEKLLNQVNSTKLNEDVIIHGAINHKDIPVWINAADLLVLPSLNEGMPNVVLEALTCHTPVVASNVGGIPEIVDEGLTGYLFEPGDINQLAGKIINALDKQWLDDEFSKITNNNTWKHAAKLLNTVLHDSRCKENT